jgi:uncharacterized protein (DUF427 family)
MTLTIPDPLTHRDTEADMVADMDMVAEASPPPISYIPAHRDGAMTLMQGAITIIRDVVIMIPISTDIIRLVIVPDVCKRRLIRMDGEVVADPFHRRAKFETGTSTTTKIGKIVIVA